jgi:chromosome segregation ATPase
MTNVSSTKWGGERGDIAATANEALEMNTSADVDQLDKMIKQLMKIKAEGEDHLIVLDKRIAQVDKQLRQRHIEITRAEKRIDDYNRAFHDREKEVERMTRRMEQVEDKLKEEKERRGKLMETRAILGRETEAAAAQYKNRMERIKYLRSRVSKISAEVERFLNQGKDELDNLRRDSGSFTTAQLAKKNTSELRY